MQRSVQENLTAARTDPVQFAQLGAENNQLKADIARAQQLLDAPNLPSLLMDDGVLVIESAKRDVLTLSLPWKISREAIYGDTRVSFLARLS